VCCLRSILSSFSEVQYCIIGVVCTYDVDIYIHVYCILPVLLFSTDEEIVTGWNNPTQSDQSWQATVQMAWQISPNLAFQLSMRCVNLFTK